MPRTKHIINVHTSTGTTEPISANMYLGEIAVQHTPNDPALWIKVGSDESSTTYEKFIGETEILNIINSNNILGSGYTYSGIPYINSSTTIADAYSALTNEIIDNEKVTAAAFNDINDRIGGVLTIETNGEVAGTYSPSANTVISFDFVWDDSLGSGYTYSGLPYVTSATSIADAYSALTKEVLDTEVVAAEALNDLNSRVNELSGSISDIHVDMILGSGYTYSGLPYVTSATSIADAYSALTSEMIDDEKVAAGAFNDLNSRVIELSGNISDFHVDMILGSGYTYSGIPFVNSSTSIADAYSALTKEVNDNEKVTAAAFNDLNDRVLELSGNTSIIEPLSGAVLEISATVLSLSAAVKSKEYVAAAAINDLDRRIDELSGNTGGGGGGDIEPLSSATYSHITNSTIHVTAQDKTTWSGKQDAINDLGTIRNNALSGASAYTNVVALSAATTAHTDNGNIHVPTGGTNGQFLSLVNGTPTWTSPITVYSGTNPPDQNLGNNGDIYLQTS